MSIGMLKAFSVMLLTVCGLAHASIVSRSTTPRSFDELNRILDDKFHWEALVTLAGVKPISEVSMSKHDFKVLNRARRDGLITNSNFGWFWENDYPSYKPGAPATDGNVWFYNRRAIEQLLRDPEIMAAL